MTTGFLLIFAMVVLPVILKGIAEILDRIGQPINPIPHGRMRDKII
jgi:hypothetical protein